MSDYQEDYDTETISIKSIDRVSANQDYTKDSTKQSTTTDGITTKSLEIVENRDKQTKSNLFQPGQSGNPKGRPRGQTIVGKLKERLDLKGGWDRIAAGLDKILGSLDTMDDDIPVDKRIALITRFLDAIRIILPYTDGRPESHQYVHRDSVNVYAILTNAIQSAKLPSDARIALIASIEQQLGRTNQAPPSGQVVQATDVTPKIAKEDPVP
jgi:hypothetical protein